MTVIELMVVIAIVGAVAVMAMPSLMGTTATARLRDASIDMTAALSHARSEAIRTGNIHLVFYQQDAGSTALNTAIGDSGAHIEVLSVDEGRPVTASKNSQ